MAFRNEFDEEEEAGEEEGGSLHRSVQRHLAHKKVRPPSDHRRALGIVLGGRGFICARCHTTGKSSSGLLSAQVCRAWS